MMCRVVLTLREAGGDAKARGGAGEKGAGGPARYRMSMASPKDSIR